MYIISESINRPRVSGPGKVVRSVVRGLSEAGLDFAVNKKPSCSGSALWIHDSIQAVWDFRHIRGRLIGPNCFVLPRDCPSALLRGAVNVQPSEWAANLWKKNLCAASEVWVWPAGIEVDKFPSVSSPRKSNSVMVYFKERSDADLNAALNAVAAVGLSALLIRYGSYDEDEFRAGLRKVDFVLWVGRYESQGIALQEALCSGVPILVWNCSRLSQHIPFPISYFDRSMAEEETTTVPYFSPQCGIVFDHASELTLMLKRMQNSSGFDPRRFIEESLHYRQRAVEIFKKSASVSRPDSSVSYRPTRCAEVFAKIVRLRWKVRNRFRLASL